MKENIKKKASLVALLVKNLPANVGDLGSIPGLGRSPGEGKGYPLQYSGLENSMDCTCIWKIPGGEHGNPLQYSCLENSKDICAWQATVRGAVKSQTQLQRLSRQAYTCITVTFLYNCHFAVYLKPTQHCKSTVFQ